MSINRIGNYILGTIIIIGGYSIIVEPVWSSARCGGCEIDLRPFHWLIGIFFIILGLYFFYINTKLDTKH